MSEDRFEGLDEALAQMGREFARSLESFFRAASDLIEGRGTGEIRSLVRHYAEHPDELAALVVARERGYQHGACHCFCQWRHDGRCAGAADTTRPFGQLWLPMCSTCAEQVDRRRDEAIGDRRAGTTPPDTLGPRTR